MYIGDFETTTLETDCRVWAWGLYDIVHDSFYHGKDIVSFFNYIKYDKPARIAFHNLKFDGEFIINKLFELGFTHSIQRKLYPNEFSTLISNMGVFYQIRINLDGYEVTITDSLKIIPLAVRDIPKAFGLTSLKGEIDYTKNRPVGYEPTADEIEYLKNDVEIVGKALKIMYQEGLSKMTTASNALSNYKDIIGKKNFDNFYPTLSMDKWLRRAYKGGYTYCNPKYQDRPIDSGLVFDVNSLYPSVMYSELMPYGKPIWFDGQYKHDDLYNLYFQAFTCQFELKKNKLPIIQLKNNMRFSSTQYLSSSDDEEITLVLTSIDFEMFLDHYDVYNMEYIGGYMFKSSRELFKAYIDKWTQVKNEATLSGNSGMRTIAKLMLNSLYGKFGLNPRVQSKNPYYDELTDMVQYQVSDEELREPIYIPVACFTTAYARRVTITGAQNNYDRFCYCDTDSLHLEGTQEPKDLVIDPIQLGAWKHESTFTKAKFLRAKTYVEVINDELHVTCAGMPKSSHKEVNFDNFQKGLTVSGKLQHKRVKGGVILKEIDFTIKL